MDAIVGGVGCAGRTGWTCMAQPTVTAATAADEPVMDLDHLTVFTDGDPSLEHELAALYVASAQHYLAAMAKALAAGEAWTAHAHALKGASANLGARRVAVLALAAERAWPQEALLAALRAAVDEVGRFFRSRHP
jgi:HPt (histidine-containing phosphotransfer) domain-containing protein